MGRQAQLVAHFQMAAGVTPESWRQLYWCASLLFSSVANPGGTNDIILTWAQCNNILPGLTSLQSSANQWKARMLAHYPQGMAQVFSLYFNNPNHPLAKWALSNFIWESASSARLP
jgi:hypothetical protein